jgi:hypothetical protein
MAFDRRATLAGRRQEQSVLKKEIAFCRTIQGRYGLPLDNRAAYTRIDWTVWTVWTVCLTGDRADFDALVAPAWGLLNATPDQIAHDRLVPHRHGAARRLHRTLEERRGSFVFLHGQPTGVV